MRTEPPLPAPLLTLRDRICARCVSAGTPQSTCEPGCTAAAQLAGWLPGGVITRPQVEVFLEEHRDVCDQCAFLLLLSSIRQQVPEADVPAWLETPDPTLTGRTPLACIDAGDYGEVVEALWLADAPGPVS
jgi:hypothetical protein